MTYLDSCRRSSVITKIKQPDVFLFFFFFRSVCKGKIFIIELILFNEYNLKKKEKKITIVLVNGPFGFDIAYSCPSVNGHIAKASFIERDIHQIVKDRFDHG